MPIEILFVCGSARTGSTNAATLRCAGEQLPDGFLAVGYGGLTELPHFNPDDDVEPPPPSVAELRRLIGAAGAVLFCTPEYAGALPGSFKNLLDWTIGGGQLSDKPVGWINCSERGAAGAHAELATVLGYAGSVPVPAACVHIPVGRAAVAADGSVTDPGLRGKLAEAVAALCGAAGS